MEETFPFHYTLMDYLLCLFGLLMSLVDIGLDCWTVVSFYQNEDYVYMAVLIFFLLGSSLLVQVFSWIWYSDTPDDLQTHVEKFVTKHHLLKAFHFMQLAVYLRYAGLVEISTRRFLRSDRLQEGISVNLNHDLFMLRLIEAFAENAPQLTLMMSIIAMGQGLTLLAAFKTLGSASALAASVVTYHRIMREFLPDKRKLKWSSSVVYFLWNLLLIFTRITALALFASVFPCYIIAHFLSVWMVLVLVVWGQKTDFMDSTCGEWLYRATVGLIWYFSWFNVGSGSTKLKNIIYYAVMGLDTMALLGFWQMECDCISLPFRSYIMIIILASLYVLGILLRILYYKKFHPNCDEKKIELHEDKPVMRAAALNECIETDSAKSSDFTKPVTGAQKRMRIMASNFY
ncbi:XK-related protein 8 [Misgurnus anguillicaudatus]|uniref:XK-related protein 8 n=1 Tax=Misgurnus anguillicaudatus TaxID=75329 RepID=UPI003CCF0CBD